MTAIRVTDLTKTVGCVTAVDGISFTVEDGELFGLLGPNGAGKSTLINMLVTLLRPTSGTATVNGHDIIEETGAVRNSLGIVFQEPALDEELTGEENLAFHSRLYGQSKTVRQQRIDEILDLVGLSEQRDDPVGTYSGGMKRRLEIGRGLLHEPAVLFLDEPTVGLDARTRRDTWEYIQRMNEETDVSVVLTTHYIEEAEQLCDRVAIVDEGRIVAIDSPTALTASLGGDVVAIDVEGRVAALATRLDACPWVSRYTTTDTGVRVTVERGETRIADLVRLADDADVAITSVDSHTPNLETVFLSLTGATLTEREADTPASDGRRPRDVPVDPAETPARANTGDGE
ncbi:daunorubicin resistance protein DrrA family ABC transporter ATP-binding protein [Halalkalicoccus jeotgali]|uniref:ABC transporter ATP-binding protein n=1 Tax=Halalkalicoccus jeotgali (strain DSM 18796 / CECT 7217 / JCM 14584 / KCTC 4019 / B3) TaxID=795797 RepID=D8J7A7_HALJB|nr:daunorubicin resistance protein DrrA family ABC transporter ATP-binding protein [Halalkalicoccus jeotgali]ADJ14002.1 ABC transporter, ATP-binding protein [Halalkalicoccus jeotgali B3]ELY33952.1 ABC transporter ATP-binding protein [Halalkalicoccus jeotgali B3]